jgi:polyhydroxyalkanoate synthesis repressor PhaR
MWYCFAGAENGAVVNMLSKAESAGDKKEPVVVKKYANRRLYNTETSTYVTLDDLAAMVRAERDFVVFDAKSGEDLTHSVLTQIIVEQESRAGAQTLLPVPFLRQLIRFYGDTMERMVPSYLQVSLETLAKEQERFRKQFATAFTPQGAFEAYQEQARKNLAMFEQAISMFAPFSGGKQGAASAGDPAQATSGATRGEGAKSTSSPAPAASRSGSAAKQEPSELDELKAQLAAMQAKLEKLSKS